MSVQKYPQAGAPLQHSSLSHPFPAPSRFENEAQIHTTGRSMSRYSEPRIVLPAALHCTDDSISQTIIDESEMMEIPLSNGRSTTGSLPSHTIAAIPSYCEMQRTGHVRVSIAPPPPSSQTSLKPCRSSASVVSCAYSDTDSSTVGPTCRICDSSGDNANRLISPCRCSGTSKFVHEQCLNKWLETINAHNAPRCEVCRYHIHTRKMYRIRNCRLPTVSTCDLALHLIFVAAISVIIVSLTFTIIGFVSNHNKMAARRPGDTLSPEDVVVLVGGLTFFIALILALLTQIRATQSLYRLFLSCIAANTEWRIDSYRRSDDSLYRK